MGKKRIRKKEHCEQVTQKNIMYCTKQNLCPDTGFVSLSEITHIFRQSHETIVYDNFYSSRSVSSMGPQGPGRGIYGARLVSVKEMTLGMSGGLFR